MITVRGAEHLQIDGESLSSSVARDDQEAEQGSEMSDLYHDKADWPHGDWHGHSELYFIAEVNSQLRTPLVPQGRQMTQRSRPKSGRDGNFSTWLPMGRELPL